MAESDVVIMGRDCTVTLLDGTATPVVLTLEYEDGTASFQGLGAEQAEVVPIVIRGALKSLRKGPPTFPTFTLNLIANGLTESVKDQVLDFIHGTGTYASNESQDGANADVHTVGLKLTVERSSHGEGSDQHLTLSRCHVTADLQIGDPGRITIAGTCYGGYTRT